MTKKIIFCPGCGTQNHDPMIWDERNYNEFYFVCDGCKKPVLVRIQEGNKLFDELRTK